MIRSGLPRLAMLGAACLMTAFVTTFTGCDTDEVDMTVVVVGPGPIQIVFPEDVDSIEVTGDFRSTLNIIDTTDGTWQMSFLSDDLASMDVQQRTTERVQIEIACQGFDDCLPTSGPVSDAFGLVANDPPILFTRLPIYPDVSMPDATAVGLRFDRVEVVPDVIFRGGRWAQLAAATCDEVEAAGSLDSWPAQTIAACETVFGAPTGDWRCGGIKNTPLELADEVVEVQCN